MLTLIQAKVKKNKNNNTFSLYRCHCGVEKILFDQHVNRGDTRSCGCYGRSIARETARRQGLKNVKHGMYGTREHRSWNALKARCNNPNNNRYYLYGGRGITVCNEWLTFEGFYRDMGNRPIGTSIDRIDTNGNYCKENCKWSTPSEQAYNRRKKVKT